MSLNEGIRLRRQVIGSDPALGVEEGLTQDEGCRLLVRQRRPPTGQFKSRSGADNKMLEHHQISEQVTDKWLALVEVFRLVVDPDNDRGSIWPKMPDDQGDVFMKTAARDRDCLADRARRFAQVRDRDSEVTSASFRRCSFGRAACNEHKNKQDQFVLPAHANASKSEPQRRRSGMQSLCADERLVGCVETHANKLGIFLHAS